MFEDYKLKPSVVIAYTGDGKGKTSASLGLVVRALGAGHTVAYIQFLKAWEVSEHKFLHTIQKTYKSKLKFIKGGKGFYKAGPLTAKGVTPMEHKQAAKETYKLALAAVKSGKYQLVVCDEIANTIHDGLLSVSAVKKLITSRSESTSLCLTGRYFPKDLLKYVDIATEMKKIKHHYDKKFLANVGIDY